MPAARRSRPQPQRRTQAERREATRTALLDACIECLVDYGYAHLTIARVAEQAGLSRGAQLNYFASKASLVSAAVAHLADKRIEELRASLSALPRGPKRMEAFLDVLWHAHQGDIFDATLELWVAARTDDELRAGLASLERDVARSAHRTAVEAVGEFAAGPAFRADFEFALATIRGMALLRAAGSEDRALNRRWPATRDRLLRALAHRRWESAMWSSSPTP